MSAGSDDRAEVHGTIERTSDGKIRGSYSITVHTGTHADAQTDFQLFQTQAEAVEWLRRVATSRGLPIAINDRTE